MKMRRLRVPLKDIWVRIELHGRELRRMRARSAAWMHMPAEGHAVAEAGFKAKTLNWSEQEAFEDDSRQCDEEPCVQKVSSDQHTSTPTGHAVAVGLAGAGFKAEMPALI